MQQPSNFSLHGAVDLGARQAAAKRRQQAQAGAQGGATGSGGSEYVIEATDATFNTEVVARSMTVPVIVDLWAEWCGPCKQLGPVLERLADEAEGAWVLAKVDVDANPQLAAALQVQSIPMVIAVIGGQLVDGFLGALPEAQVRQWVGQVVQAAAQAGLGAGAGAGAGAAAGSGNGTDGDALAERADQDIDAELLGEPGFRAARAAMDAGDLDAAAAALEQVLADSPGHPLAKAWLAQVELFRRVSAYDAAKVRRAAEESPNDPQAQAEAADLELAAGQVQTSFDRMLGVVQRTTGEDRDQARRHLLDLFEILSPRDPEVTRARSRLSSLLF
jgi:putative thioredoxin